MRVRLARPLYSYTGQEPSQRNNACLDVNGLGIDWGKGNQEMAGVNAEKLGLGGPSSDGDMAAAKTLGALILHSSCPHEGFYCCDGTHDQKQVGEESIYLAELPHGSPS